MTDSDCACVGDLEFLQGGGELGALIRSKDWSQTSIGHPESWPQSLRTVVSLCLASNFPINIVWGPGRVQIYNDAYRQGCGDAHPQALGEDYCVSWGSAWSVIGESFERAQAGETMFLANQRMFLRRLDGKLAETFFTFSHSPIRDESGGIGGLFHPVTETTATMLAERRTRALGVLATSLAAAKDEADIARRTVNVLAEYDADLPFVLFYRLHPEAFHYGLVGSAGIEADSELAPRVIEPNADTPWPVAEALASGSAVEIIDLAARIGDMKIGPYPEAPDRALLIPIQVPAALNVPACLVLGVSSRLPLDDEYRSFYRLLGITVTNALSTIRALEDEKQRAEALAEIDRAKTTFFSNVSHEFRTPLTLMLAPIEDALASRDPLPPEQRERLQIAHRNAMRLLRLVNTLLDFSRIEAGRAEAIFRPVDLAVITADIASSFRSAAERAGLALKVDTPSLSQPVYVDRDLWEKIVLNLLSNAFKFTFEGEIAIALREADGSATLIVRDTGTGIPEAELPKLFDRFYRVAGARGRSFEGSGIGLTLVQELVKQHGGNIAVTSDVGCGTTFTVTIPLGSMHLPASSIASALDEAPYGNRAQMFVEEALRWLPEPTSKSDTVHYDGSEALESPSEQAKRRVLIADDNADLRAYLTRMLSGQGYEVLAVPDGEAALARLRDGSFDLLLTDVMMPKVDGFALLRSVRDDPVLRELPVILLSARAGEEARIEGLAAGADDYLTKPFSGRELLARIAAAITVSLVRREGADALRMLNETLEDQVALRTAERDLMWETSPDLMLIIDFEGYFRRVNPAWTAVLGYTLQELVGHHVNEFVLPDDHLGTIQAYETAANGGSPRIENRYRHKDGSTRWISWAAAPAQGLTYATGRDITREKNQQVDLEAAQDALRQSQKMEAVGQLTGGLAHDFNNLLAAITGSMELLKLRLTQGRLTDLDRYVAAALGASSKAAALTHRLLAFSRRQALEPRRADVNVLITDMTDLISRTIGPQIELIVATAPELWNAFIDPPQLENALLNLCINARDAMANGGKIIIQTANHHFESPAAENLDLAPGDYLSLSVSDTGTGIPPELLVRIFDPFFTTKPIGEGTGLGLSMIYGFAKQSRGSITVDSTLGEGTTMCLYMPRCNEWNLASDYLNVVAKPATKGQGEVILIVEDEPVLRMLATEMLSDLGYTTLEAAGSAGGLEILNAHGRIDLLITDVGLPGLMNGRQLAQAARVVRPGLRVLFVTGYADTAFQDEGPLEANMEILAKPYSADAFTARVARLLHK